MCLQCLPFFSKSRDSPPSSPRPVGSPKRSPAEEQPSLEQPLLSFSTDHSHETTPSPQESYGTPQTALSTEPVSTSVDSFQTPQVGVPMEAFFTPLTAASQAESGESYAESPTKSTSVKEPESTSPEFSSLQVPIPGFAFPEALQGVPATSRPMGEGSPSDDPASKGESPLEDVPEPTSLETTQSAPALEVPQTDENDSQLIHSAVADTAKLDSSQSDSTLEVFNPPGFAGAVEGPGRHRRHFRKHLQEFQQHLMEGGQLIKEEGTRHFQSVMDNMNK